ncbi:FAD-dependent oxidoreductase [Myxococcota bacterium]|nr:FAD-dependent oxidoreductase [Myxococcota bacterium]
MNQQPLPQTCDVLVIGGGPAGSTAATHLAKQGLDVVLIDKGSFPRPTIGESVVPQVWKLTDALGISDKISETFVHKSGGLVSWGGKIAYLKFTDFGYKRSGLHVDRNIFDELLLRHAESLGARVFEGVISRHVDFSVPGAPCVKYDDRRSGAEVPGEIRAKFVVDASGFASVLSKQFNSRKFLQADKKYMSLWGYFENSRYFDSDGKSHPAEEMLQVKPSTLQVQYKDGWAWHIIMKDHTSVGFVFYSDHLRGMSAQDREKYFLQCCADTPHMKDLLVGARYIPDSLSFRPDYSYYSEKVVGDDFLAAGDAAAFVDPIFSQGILGCLFHGTAASWSIAKSLQNPARKAEYLEMYRRRILGFYSAARLIALGQFGEEGVDLELAREFVKGLPPSEVQLLFTAAWQTDRHQNMIRLAQECGLDITHMTPKSKLLAELH